MSELDQLHAFVLTAELRSFTAAARRLGLSQTLVSRRIKTLERRLGLTLFHRTTRAVALTADGARYLERVREPLEAIRRAEAELKAGRDAPAGLLRVSAPVGFGAAHVAPAVETYLARFREAEVALTLTDRMVDMVAERVDLAIRIGHGGPADARRTGLGALRQCLVATPDRAAALATVEAVEAAPAVVYSAYAEPFQWRLSSGARRQTLSIRRARLAVDCVPSLRAAVLAGLGVAKIPRYAVSDDLAAGRLCEILPDWSAGELPLAALMAPGGSVPARVRLFLETLRSRLRIALEER